MKHKLIWIIILLFCYSFTLLAHSPHQSFKIGKQQFLLNDEPFIIKAGELHYSRIPRAYWEHRIKMCKALGLNTICIYIFWNLHEPAEGQFNFQGQNDIAEFCRLVQKEGMYIIVRPGPYICAEWEMGGLPWWLLKKRDIVLRSLDPYFMKHVKKYILSVGKQLSELQISKGGNIIMVQVENEYGAYGKNKPYMSAIRDFIKEAGFTEVPLFQCDWNSNFEKNALDDLLWTVNFGTGVNISQQFKRLKQLRPDSPLMCSEYWTGWFDHWGKKHETRNAENMINGLKEMLDKKISFSLYMVHGGTSFGHWSGANSPTYSTMCTSYDYDAPINESGQPTYKYFELQNLLSKYEPSETKRTIPDPIPSISIPNIHINEVSYLFENRPKANKYKETKTFEELNLGWGCVLYKTELPPINTASVLIIKDIHDWAQVYINGKRISTLDRRKGENSIWLPPTDKASNLEILIEGMGRVNFGKAIHDNKGITEKVEIRNRNFTTPLYNWEMFCYPDDYTFISSRNFKPYSKSSNNPAYYKGSFSVSSIGDTFLDMRKWGKGMVWINGHAIGRFWEIGPQQTLYVPGCWLKKGKNEIIILDLNGPSDAQLSGLKNPILDLLREKEHKHHKTGESINLEEESATYENSLEKSNDWQNIRFPNVIQGRYFCLEALNAHDGKQFASIAELEILDKTGNPLPRENWKIIYADSEETKRGNHTADKIFDLQESTFWNTEKKGKYPHHLIIDLGEECEISGFQYLSRSEKNNQGMIKDYKIYIKTSPFKIRK